MSWQTKIEAHCEASLEDIALRHKSLSACLVAAGRLDEIEACEKPSGRFDSVIGAVASKNERICGHVMDIMNLEMGDAAEQPSDEDTRKLMGKCVIDIETEKKKIGYAVFAEQSRCVMASKNMEELMKCEECGRSDTGWALVLTEASHGRGRTARSCHAHATMSSPRLTLLGLALALASLVAACTQDERAKQTIEAALEVSRTAPSPPEVQTPAWTGEPLPITKLGPDSWTAVELPGEPFMATRLADAWLLSSPDDATPSYTDDRLTLWRDGEEPRLLAEGISARQLLRLGDEVLVSVEAEEAVGEGGEGEGYHLRLVGDSLERVEMPVGHVAQLGDRRFVATGWSLSARSFRVIELGPEGSRTLFESEDGVRTVGMGVIGERLVVGVQHRDASGGASVQARAQAIAQLEGGHGEAAAALAGPARSHLLEIDLRTGETRTEPFPEQRMQNLAVLDGGWLVVVGEGTLAKGLRDAVVVARGPDERSGWRLLARDLETSLSVDVGGRWLCLTATLAPGQALHCFSPELGRHLVTPGFAEMVLAWDVAPLDGRTQLIFRVSGARAGDAARVLALPLE